MANPIPIRNPDTARRNWETPPDLFAAVNSIFDFAQSWADADAKAEAAKAAGAEGCGYPTADGSICGLRRTDEYGQTFATFHAGCGEARA